MTIQSNKLADEQAIRRIIDETAKGLFDLDVEQATRHYAEGAPVYALAPPLVADGGPEGIQKWFDTWSTPIRVTRQDLTIAVDGDVAFAHGLSHMAGTRTDGTATDLWYRTTWGLRRIEGAWKIAHEHESVPMLMDGSRRAALDLKP